MLEKHSQMMILSKNKITTNFDLFVPVVKFGILSLATDLVQLQLLRQARQQKLK